MENINARIAHVVEQSGLSKTAFSQRIGVSQQYVSKLTKNGVPSDRTILDICRAFGVNEVWLRSGEGEMLTPLTQDEEIARFFGQILSDESASGFKKRVLSALSRLEEGDWQALERIAGLLWEKKD